MDEINDFFNFSKNFERQTISAGYVNGRTVKTEDSGPVKREHQGTEYVEEFRAREHDDLSKVMYTCHTCYSVSWWCAAN